MLSTFIDVKPYWNLNLALASGHGTTKGIDIKPYWNFSKKVILKLILIMSYESEKA